MADPMVELAFALEKYPDLKPFISMPGVADVLAYAIAHPGTTPAIIQQHFEQTYYWQHTTAAGRAWDLLKGTDPQTATQKWNAGFEHMADLRKKLGVNITEGEYQMIANMGVRDGWSDDTITQTMLGVHHGGRLAAGGDYGAAITQVRALANDYGINTSTRTQLDQATALLTGGADAAGTAEYYKNHAISQFGDNKHLVAALNRGLTVKQYADPYLQMAANEVGVNPADMALTSPKWNAFLTQTDPTTGSHMTLADWQRTLRNDPRYHYNGTAGAVDQAAQLTSALAREFGATG